MVSPVPCRCCSKGHASSLSVPNDVFPGARARGRIGPLLRLFELLLHRLVVSLQSSVWSSTRLAISNLDEDLWALEA